MSSEKRTISVLKLFDSGFNVFTIYLLRGSLLDQKPGPANFSTHVCVVQRAIRANLWSFRSGFASASAPGTHVLTTDLTLTTDLSLTTDLTLTTTGTQNTGRPRSTGIL